MGAPPNAADPGTSFFSAPTVDDALRYLLEAVRRQGRRINPTKGPATELTGVLVALTNPRSRLSRTESRGKVFSGLGELCWYLSGSNEVGFIEYYIPRYRQHSEGGVIHGGYGPRLFGLRGHNQIENVIALLRKNPDSRQAVIQLFDAADIAERHKDTPCTCTCQFMVRGGHLEMLTSMRSNDVFIGFPHDVFCFTMLQEIIARDLGVEVGVYKHVVGSLHLYDDDIERARAFLEEGWQPTGLSMPAMPIGDPWASIQRLLSLEATVRGGRVPDPDELSELDPYWADLARLLVLLFHRKRSDRDAAEIVRRQMSSRTFDVFIDGSRPS